VKEDRPTIFADLGYSVLDTVMLERQHIVWLKRHPSYNTQVNRMVLSAVLFYRSL